MKLVIAEKPQLGEAIAAALPGRGVTKDGVIYKGDYTIVWAFGHLLTLKEPEDYDSRYENWSLEDLPLFFDNWGLKAGKDDPKKPGRTSKSVRLKQIGGLLKQADCVIHAGDVDEEGQLLIDEILRWFSYSGPVWRINTSDTAEGAIKKALMNLKDNKQCEPDGWAAFGRELSDAVFGFNLTRYFTVKNNVFLPVGRVQTPTLGMVVNRDTLIEGHKKTLYYELFADLWINGDRNQNVQVKFNPDPEDPNLTDGKFLRRDDVLAKRALLPVGHFTSPELFVEISVKKEQPPLPFNLTKLTSYCSRKWGYNPDDVMQITQRLRENYKAITYNRSDCQYLSEEHFKEAPETVKSVLSNLSLSSDGFDTAIKSRCFNDANLTAHFAIIPTVEKVDVSKMSDRERNVYIAICHYYLAQFMPPSVKEQTKLIVDVGRGASLTASATTILSPGYRSLLVNEHAADEAGEEDGENSILTGIPAGSYSGYISSTEVKEKETKPPARYTQASLAEDMTRIAKYVDDPHIKKLLLEKDKEKTGENGSIGTSATRPFIIKKLIEDGYLTEVKKGKTNILISTPKGREFYAMLPDEIKKADLTAKWWTIQEDIKQGTATPEQMARDVLSTVTTVIASGVGSLHNAQSYAYGGTGVVLGACPLCGGSIIETEKAFSCSNKDCNCVFFKDNKLLKSVGKKMTAGIVKSLISKGRAPLKDCKSARTGKSFSCDVVVKYEGMYPSLEFDFDAEPASFGSCPLCGREVVKNKFENYACSNWRNGCKFTIFGTIAGKKISEASVRALLTKGFTQELSGFNGKNGKKFDARLVLGSDGKVNFQFLDHPKKR